MQLSGDVLTDDVLLEIFDYLDEDDLGHCEAVCPRWYRLTYFTFKRLYNRNLQSSATWKKCAEAVAIKDEAGGGLYRQTFHQVQDLYKNWKTLNFEKTIHRLDEAVDDRNRPAFIMNDHHLIEKKTTYAGRVLNRMTMRVENEIFLWTYLDMERACRSDGNVIMVNHLLFFRLRDANTGQLLHQVPVAHDYVISDICIGPRGLISTISKFSESNDGNFRLDIWRMDSSVNIAHLKQLPIKFPVTSIAAIVMDGNFIVVSQKFSIYRRQFDLKRRFTAEIGRDRWVEIKTAQTFYFISTDTLEVERSLSLSAIREAHYSHGVLIIVTEQNCIRLVDISAGRCSPTANLKPFYWTAVVKANSRHLVVMRLGTVRNINGSFRPVKSSFGIYDLQGIQSGKCTWLLAYFEIPFITCCFQVDDTEIVCMGHAPNSNVKEIIVFNFMPKQPIRQAKKRKISHL